MCRAGSIFINSKIALVRFGESDTNRGLAKASQYESHTGASTAGLVLT
jgi:hypothetical protein